MSDHIWLYALVLAIVAAAVLVLGINALISATMWWHLRRVIHSGRCVKWTDALLKCRRGQAVIVLASKKWPRQFWLVEGSGLHERERGIAGFRENGKLVTDLPSVVDSEVISREGITESFVDASGGSLM